MGATLFRGASDLRSWISTYLQATLPGMLTKARTDWALATWQLPTPVLYDMYDMDKVGTNQYPAIGSDFATESNYVRTDFTDAAEPEYLANYQGGVYVWVATPRNTTGDVLEGPDHRATCMRVRDDLTEVVRQALLVKPSIGRALNEVWLEETSVNVNKMEPMKRANLPDYIAGAIISVTYRVRSELWIPPIGAANTINTIVEKLED